jgi:hypothetical protein
MNIITFTIIVAATNRTPSVFFSFVRNDGCLLENGISVVETENTPCISLHVSLLGYNTAFSDCFRMFRRISRFYPENYSVTSITTS